VPDANGAEPDVKIREADPEQAHPCPEQVSLVEAANAAISLIAGRCFRELIQKAAGQMSQRMTTERITAEEDNINGQNQSSDSDSK
jgi:hypothetical protein